ncbi:MAG: hypothetical protein Kow00109_16530 [Acidobacteriota bacterium]
MSRRSSRGFTLLSLLLVLLVIGAVWWIAFHAFPTAPAGNREAVAMHKAAGALQCAANRRTLEQELMAWEVRHPARKPTLEALAKEGVLILGCPEGGRWSLAGGKVRCSRHDPGETPAGEDGGPLTRR